MLIFLIILILIITSIYSIYITINHHNYDKRGIEYKYIKNVFLTHIGGFVLVGLMLYVNKEILFNQRIIPELRNIISSLLFTDTLYYWSHRTFHKIPYMKENFHIQHHSHYDLLPSDVFDGSVVEKITEILIIAIIPTLLFKLNIIEFIIILSIIYTLFLYIHSESKEKFILPMFITSEFHKNHHQIGKGNYSVLFPFWDEFMDTLIKVPSAA